MGEELLQRGLIKNPEKIGNWDFYNIGSTTVRALREYGIIRKVDYGEVGKKKVDGLIVNRKQVIAVIEYKKPAEFKTTEQKKKAIAQEIETARKLKARIIIATDTKDTWWVNVLARETEQQNPKSPGHPMMLVFFSILFSFGSGGENPSMQEQPSNWDPRQRTVMDHTGIQ
jgi:hypothetical protein